MFYKYVFLLFHEHKTLDTFHNLSLSKFKNFGIHKLEDLTKLFDKNFLLIKDPIEDAINSFTDLMNVHKGGLVNTTRTMIEQIRKLENLTNGKKQFMFIFIYN